MNNDLKYLKKFYGEDFSHLCRSLFPTILEREGILSEIIDKHFEPTKSLCDTLKKNKLIEEFKSYIYEIYDKKYKKDKLLKNSDLTAVELMDKAGYILYPECTTYDQIDYFKHYYAPDEVLCTFSQPRLSIARVWFAVKKDVDKIFRNDPQFKNPHRQDEYGTSVISIQFSRADNSLSIKNRYNHTVENPDSTFSNDLENIIQGLTKAFYRDYKLVNLKKDKNFSLPGFIKANDKKFYHYNVVKNNQYFCDNNIVIENGIPTHISSDSTILADEYIIDFKGKK